MKKLLFAAVAASVAVLFVSLSSNAQTLPGRIGADSIVRVELIPRTITRYLPGETRVVHDTIFVAETTPIPEQPLISGDLVRQSLFGIGTIGGLLLFLLGLIAYLLYRRLQQQPAAQQQLPNFAPTYTFAPVFSPTFNPTTGDIEVTRPAAEEMVIVVRERTMPAPDAAPQGGNQNIPSAPTEINQVM